MVECNSIGNISIEASNLSVTPLYDQVRLNKIMEIKDYFIIDIKERKLMSKILRKYIDCILIVLSTTNGSISIASISTVIGRPAGIASASRSPTVSFSAGLVIKLFKTTRDKKKKHNKIVMLARSKLNSIESKISKALMNNQFSHEDFMTIINKERI